MAARLILKKGSAKGVIPAKAGIHSPKPHKSHSSHDSHGPFLPGKPELLSTDGALLRIRLPIRLTNGNAGRGGSWHGSAQFREECELMLRAWKLTRIPFDVPVTVKVIRILGKGQRLWDSSSGLRGNWKEIEDALVAVGWFVDDKPAWIRRTDFDQCDTDRQHGPAIQIEIVS